MEGILVEMSASKARAMRKKKEIGMEWMDDTGELLPGRTAVIGAEQADGRWMVTLTARIGKVLTKSPRAKLQYVRAHSGDASWQLPNGYPSFPTVFEDVGHELLENETHVQACLLGASALAAPRIPKRPPFRLDAKKATADLVVTFDKGQPVVWSTAAYARAATARPQTYRSVLRSFLSGLTQKGWDFERVLEDLFGKEGVGFDVQPTPKTRDEGIDLWLERRCPVAGKERYAVQAKNQEAKVLPRDVSDVADVAQAQGAAKAIFVAPGGFTPQAKKRAAERGVQLIDLADLTALIWPRLERMTWTFQRFTEWQEGAKAQEGTRPLPL